MEHLVYLGPCHADKVPVILRRYPLSRIFCTMKEWFMKWEKGTFADYHTPAVNLIKFLVVGWQPVLVSVKEGSLCLCQ